MKASKCDRCGEFYPEKEKDAIAGALEAFYDALKSRKLNQNQKDLFDEINFNFDLCEDCENSLREWIRGGTKNAEQTSCE